MAFADLLDLRTAVLEQVGRTDLADIFTRLVKLAETGLNRRLRMRDQFTETTLTLASGTVALPSDFLEAIAVYDSQSREYIASPVQTAAANACRYAIEGSNLTIYRLSGNVTLQYYAKLPTITDSMTDTNWLLQKYPDVYLYSVSCEALKHVRDVDSVVAAKSLADAAIAEAMADDQRAKYARARVRVRGCTP